MSFVHLSGYKLNSKWMVYRGFLLTLLDLCKYFTLESYQCKALQLRLISLARIVGLNENTETFTRAPEIVVYIDKIYIVI